MTGLSDISDEELKGLYSSHTSKMTNEELKSAYQAGNKPSFLSSIFSGPQTAPLSDKEKAQQEQAAQQAEANPQAGQEAGYKRITENISPQRDSEGGHRLEGAATDAIPSLALGMATAPLAGAGAGLAAKGVRAVAGKVGGDVASAAGAATVGAGLDALANSGFLPKYLELLAKGGSKAADWIAGAKMFKKFDPPIAEALKATTKLAPKVVESVAPTVAKTVAPKVASTVAESVAPTVTNALKPSHTAIIEALKGNPGSAQTALQTLNKMPKDEVNAIQKALIGGRETWPTRKAAVNAIENHLKNRAYNDVKMIQVEKASKF
jgi:hypothetical protein